MPNERPMKAEPPLPRKRKWERKVRHRSRTEKLKARPIVRNGKFFDDVDDERDWIGR